MNIVGHRKSKIKRKCGFIFVPGKTLVMHFRVGLNGVMIVFSRLLWFCIVKPKPIVTCYAFSRAWRLLHVFSSNSDWFISLPASVVLVLS